MLVVGLLSGGKDSVYNLLHCVLNGHQPIALASLGPPAGKDELDSYMYQTVGHSGLASIAAALELPLFTHTIKGKPINIDSSYGTREGTAAEGKGKHRVEKGTSGDETEDLMALLSAVKEALPEVQGVACGAILSNYQRVRVEHVCARLGLTPIAYLWERNQRELLGEMVAAEMNSVLVKVAGAGLKVDHLGKSLAVMEPTLHRLNERYETHICGEGGEYETFTLDCPLFRRRIVLDKVTTVVSNADPYSTVAHLHLDECSLAEKPAYPRGESFDEMRERISGTVGVPPLLEDWAEQARDAIRTAYGELPVELQAIVHPELTTSDCTPGPSAKLVGDWLSFAEVTAYADADTTAALSLEDEVRACFASLQRLLTKHDATLLDVSHLTVYLSPESMALFPAINAVYATYFGTAPPTRACVSIVFPGPTTNSPSPRLKLDGVAYLDRKAARNSLHVQSLSYWAAANIGPYSQAITVAGARCFVAGQIALVPRSLALPAPFDLCTEVALSLQHVGRVVEAAREGRWQGWTEGGVCWLADVGSEREWARRVRAAEAGWEAFLEKREQPYAPMVFVSAAALPKGAVIEWQFTYAAASAPSPQEDLDSEDERAARLAGLSLTQEFGGRAVVEHNGSVWMSSASRGIAKTVQAWVVCSADGQRPPEQLASLGAIHSVRAFHLPSVSVDKMRETAQRVLGLGAARDADWPALSTVAVHRLAVGAEFAKGVEHDIAFWLTVSTV